ncbi:uncharacterized protein PG998_002937 [Apiospora kogelbergensis]|uniref:uncharacterized protein n=1 Tax=Apiospora kogelbergensis TaxID=1337665 RepID=UPI00312F5D09
MSNLAASLQRQGKDSEAEEMHRQTLELKEKVLGREHPKTMKSRRNLEPIIDPRVDEVSTTYT